CQAEDGIRDGHVTGVQTCALPICVTLIVPPTTSREPSYITTAPRSGSATKTRCVPPSTATITGCGLIATLFVRAGAANARPWQTERKSVEQGDGVDQGQGRRAHEL